MPVFDQRGDQVENTVLIALRSVYCPLTETVELHVSPFAHQCTQIVDVRPTVAVPDNYRLGSTPSSMKIRNWRAPTGLQFE